MRHKIRHERVAFFVTAEVVDAMFIIISEIN